MHEPKVSALRSQDRYCSSESTVKPTNVWSNCFSDVCDLQTIRFEAKCTVAASRFSCLGRFEGATLTSVHAEWRESATAVLPHARLAAKQVAFDH